MKLYAPAKINLRLKIEGRRDDGYHYLSMLNATCDLFDEITLFKHDGDTNLLTIADSEIGVELKNQAKNSVLEAVKLFQKEFSIADKVSIELAKYIPSGAGLGGGSSDAAAVLKGMRTLYAKHLQVSLALSDSQIDQTLAKLALQIGSDVPFFLSKGFAKVGGVGERVEDLEFPLLGSVDFLLILPNQHISTEEVYKDLRALQSDFQEDQSIKYFSERIQSAELDQEGKYQLLLSLVGNDLEPIACKRSELVRDILIKLRKQPQLLACMSGSGSAIFVLSKSSLAISMAQLAQIDEILFGLPLLIRKTSFLRA